MLNDREQRELQCIEQALTREEPKLAQMLAGEPPTPTPATVAWLIVAALPTVAAGFVHIALALLVGGTSVIVVTMIALLRA